MINVYLFHLIQSAGILTTTIAAGYNQKYLVWVGIGLNITASLINIYEKISNNLLQKLMDNIEQIKKGNYVDGGILVNTDDNKTDDTKTDDISSQDLSQQIHNNNNNNNNNNNTTNNLSNP